ncbi:MAG TPA: hypothetical protein PJ988_19430 [Anaerolinea sp.]|nr:hypothetical protein [Anaerolinea sp.]
MAEEINTTSQRDDVTWRSLVGGALLIGGGFALLDQLLRLGWLAPLSGLAGGLFLLAGGIRNRQKGLLIAGSIVVGFGLGIATSLEYPGNWSVVQRIGLVALFGGAGFGLAEFTMNRVRREVIWWPAIPLAILVSGGVCMFVTPARLLDFVLYISLGLGLVLLGIGLSHHWIGLVIPGCLLVWTGLGVYIPWGTSFGVNALSKTGGMLVLFAFGWGLITVFSRVVMKGPIWWPLIPGGLLAVVGWGLYSGENPGNAFRFISNTGTVAIILIGFYLMMMRRGIR